MGQRLRGPGAVGHAAREEFDVEKRIWTIH
jgi:hypothetical protein